MLREFTTLQHIFRLVEESTACWWYNHSGVGLCATILSLNDDQLVTISDLELLLLKKMSKILLFYSSLARLSTNKVWPTQTIPLFFWTVTPSWRMSQCWMSLSWYDLGSANEFSQLFSYKSYYCSFENFLSNLDDSAFPSH